MQSSRKCADELAQSCAAHVTPPYRPPYRQSTSMFRDTHALNAVPCASTPQSSSSHVESGTYIALSAGTTQNFDPTIIGPTGRRRP